MTSIPKARYVWFAVIAAAGLVADLWSKHYMFSWLGMPQTHEPVWVVPGYLSFETGLNEGALFGLGQGWGIAFISLSLLALAGIGYWVFWKGAAGDRWLNFALALLTGGIIGNLYDRLGLPGLTWHWAVRGHQVGDPVYAVRDFIHFQCPWFDWPIFNLADMYLVCGVAMLALHAYVLEPLQMRRAQQAEAGAAGTSGNPKPAGSGG